MSIVTIPRLGEVRKLPLRLIDISGGLVTGVTYDAAGMTVSYFKDGDTAYTTFPSFGDKNWDEVGFGNYLITISGSIAAERALLDRVGHFMLYVNTDATRGDVYTYYIQSDIGNPQEYPLPS